ncbi:hypothetical protein EVAR_59896_1 [Eumeta japonica]|uniref:Uncharacterized protein n=1 Tax=Eumeta variegata TaxID=151549 RepID=A0A4C2AEK1_EUMVA|nr:hypothetical protein EVAR_59896_1 [Eumeta japonica]
MRNYVPALSISGPGILLGSIHGFRLRRHLCVVSERDSSRRRGSLIAANFPITDSLTSRLIFLRPSSSLLASMAESRYWTPTSLWGGRPAAWIGCLAVLAAGTPDRSTGVGSRRGQRRAAYFVFEARPSGEVSYRFQGGEHSDVRLSSRHGAATPPLPPVLPAAGPRLFRRSERLRSPALSHVRCFAPSPAVSGGAGDRWRCHNFVILFFFATVPTLGPFGTLGSRSDLDVDALRDPPCRHSLPIWHPRDSRQFLSSRGVVKL